MPDVIALLRELMPASGAASWGRLPYASALSALNAEAREKVKQIVARPAGIVVAAYPYWNGQKAGNPSYYCRGEDYHPAVIRRLESVCVRLREEYPDNQFVPLADKSPLPEVVLARRAGVGVIGLNGLISVAEYGSYVFLGTILTDLFLPGGGPVATDCGACRHCMRCCPSHALYLEGGKWCYDMTKCLSAVSQKRGDLTDQEATLLWSTGSVFGCDICQNCCPMIKNAIPSPLDDLAGRGEVPYLASLTPEDIEGLTDRTFREKYGRYAFAWRGLAPLRRNLTLRQKDE